MTAQPQKGETETALIFTTHDRCEPWEDNPRSQADEMDREMRDLIASVSANGVRQSLIVRAHPENAGRFQIAAGARRWHALGHAIRAGARPVDDPLPVRIEQLDSIAMKACALEENLQRKPMTVLEEAEAYHALTRGAHRGDRATATLAQRIGKSRRHIQTYIALARDLSDTAKAALDDGRINLAHAKVMTGVPKADQERFITEQVGSKPLRKGHSALKAMVRSSGKKARALDKHDKPTDTAASPLRPRRRSRDPVRIRAEALRTEALRKAISKKPTVGIRLATLLVAREVRGPRDILPKTLRALIESPSPVMQWEQVAELSAPKLRTLLVQAVASVVAPRLASLGRPSELLPILRDEIALGDRAVGHIDEEWLQLYRKPQLLAVAVQCGAFAADRVNDLESRTPTEIRTAILESETRDRHWVPSELRFETPLDEPTEASNL